LSAINTFPSNPKNYQDDEKEQVFDTNNRVIDDGKYLKLWKKTKQGWKIYRDVFNSDRKASEN